MSTKELKLGHVGCLRSFCTVNDFKFNSLAFLKGLKAIHVQSRIMNEYVIPLFVGDETISFLVVEPFHRTSVQVGTSLL